MLNELYSQELHSEEFSITGGTRVLKKIFKSEVITNDVGGSPVLHGDAWLPLWNMQTPYHVSLSFSKLG